MVAAGYLAWRIARAPRSSSARGLPRRPGRLLHFLVGTADGFAVLARSDLLQAAVLAETTTWFALRGVAGDRLRPGPPTRAFGADHGRATPGRRHSPSGCRDETDVEIVDLERTSLRELTSAGTTWPGTTLAWALRSSTRTARTPWPSASTPLDVEIVRPRGLLTARREQARPRCGARQRQHGRCGEHDFLLVIVEGTAGQSAARPARGGPALRPRRRRRRAAGISMSRRHRPARFDRAPSRIRWRSGGSLVGCGDAGEALVYSIYETISTCAARRPWLGADSSKGGCGSITSSSSGPCSSGPIRRLYPAASAATAPRASSTTSISTTPSRLKRSERPCLK